MFGLAVGAPQDPVSMRCGECGELPKIIGQNLVFCSQDCFDMNAESMVYEEGDVEGAGARLLLTEVKCPAHPGHAAEGYVSVIPFTHPSGPPAAAQAAGSGTGGGGSGKKFVSKKAKAAAAAAGGGAGGAGGGQAAGEATAERAGSSGGSAEGAH